MLKAKAICKVNSLHDLIGGMQNIVIESVGSDETIPDAVGQLAIKMMKNNVIIKDLLHELRQFYIRGQKDFRLSLVGRSDSEKKLIISIFQDMVGLVSNVRYSAELQSLNGSLVVMPKAKMFLTGQYLEHAVYRTIKDVLNELSVKYQAEYEVYRNVRVADREGKLKNEFDIAFQFNGIWYIVECKSGKCFSDWGSFAELGVTYNIVPDRLLLVDSYISDSKAECIEYFCDYYVSNLSANSLQDKVTKMVINDLTV